MQGGFGQPPGGGGGGFGQPPGGGGFGQPPGGGGGFGTPAPQQQGGFGAPPPSSGGFGAPPPGGGGFGAPPPGGGGFGAPPPGGFGQQGGGGAPAFGPPPGGPSVGAPPPAPGAPPPSGGEGEPNNIGLIIAGLWLAVGLLGCVGTGVAGAMSESMGVNISYLGIPMFFGGLGAISVAPFLRTKGAGAAIGAPIGCGCLGYIMATVLVGVFYTAIWPSL